MEAAASTARRGAAANGHAVDLATASDERLVALVRQGTERAFDALVARYRLRLLALCRQMTNGDGEDMLQETFLSAYIAIRSDERPLNVGPWLYRIARNRCVSHLRRRRESGQASIEVFEHKGETAAETVQRREDLRQLVSDVHELPRTQRTALVLHEFDAHSYDQVARAMETTVPGVKSLLVRARTSLVEAAEARELTCEEVRLDLERAQGAVAKVPASVRRHARSCAGCSSVERELRRRRRVRRSGRVLAGISGLGLVAGARKLIAKVTGGSASKGAGAATAQGTTGGSAVGTGSTVAGGSAAGGSAAGGAAAGGSGLAGTAVAGGAAAAGEAAAVGGGASLGFLSGGIGAVAVKATGGLVAAALAAGGGIEVSSVLGDDERSPSPVPAVSDSLPPPPSSEEPTLVDRSAVVERVLGARQSGQAVTTLGGSAPAPPASPAELGTSTEPTEAVEEAQSKRLVGERLRALLEVLRQKYVARKAQESEGSSSQTGSTTGGSTGGSTTTGSNSTSGSGASSGTGTTSSETASGSSSTSGSSTTPE